VPVFSPSQHQAVVDKINEGVPKALSNIGTVRDNALTVADFPLLPPGMGHVIRVLVDEVVKVFEDFMTQFQALIDGLGAPLEFWARSDEWETIRGQASLVAGQITPGVLGSTGDWSGPAATAYTKAIGPQSTAASTLAAVADKTATALTICAVSGLAFYTALALLLAQFIAIQIAAGIADVTVVGTIPGLIVALQDTVSTGSLIVAAVVSLSAVLGTQTTQMIALHGTASDNTAFPGGHWPKATGI
jgi:hypothetical protein